MQDISSLQAILSDGPLEESVESLPKRKTADSFESYTSNDHVAIEFWSIDKVSYQILKLS